MTALEFFLFLTGIFQHPNEGITEQEAQPYFII